MLKSLIWVLYGYCLRSRLTFFSMNPLKKSQIKQKTTLFSVVFVVDDTRLELVTSRTSSGCATSCANRPGGDKRDRTADLLNAIQALSQLSYTPVSKSKYSRKAHACQAFFCFSGGCLRQAETSLWTRKPLPVSVTGGDSSPDCWHRKLLYPHTSPCLLLTTRFLYLSVSPVCCIPLQS